jgi:translin
MASVEELRQSITRFLDEEENVREISYSLTREIIRKCRRSISDLVQGDVPDDSDILPSVQNLKEILSSAGGSRFPFVEDAYVEVAEEVILKTILLEDRLPSIDEAGVTERAYVLGACDSVGEIRRVILNKMLKGDIESGIHLFKRMNDLSRLVEGLAYPSGMIQLKKKQDVVRALMDRTAGELAIALNSKRMED